jgi:hypothetical protein
MSKANQRYVSWARKRWVAAVKRHIGPKKIRQIAIEKALTHLERFSKETTPTQLAMFTNHYEREIYRLQ